MNHEFMVTAAIWLLLGAVQTAAQPPSHEPRQPTDDTLPNFHRVFLPIDQIEGRRWQQRYLPIDKAEFERELQAVADAARGVPATRPARLEQASYRARLVGEELLVGSAEWRVSSNSAAPVLLPIEPSNFAIESAHWRSGADSQALLGTDRTGVLQLLVEGTDLTCQWSRRGERTASGAVKFVLELPPCPLASLELTLPAGAELISDRGVANRIENAEANDWRLDLGGHPRVELRIVPTEAVRERRSLTLLRQNMSFEFTSRGINLSAQLRLDVHGEPLERLEIDLDPELHLVGARFGDQTLAWSATTDLDSGQTLIHLEFPEPLSGTGRVLQLAAVAPLVTDRRFVLPRMQPRGVAWQEGSSDLLIPAALLLEQLNTVGCRQSRVTALPAPLAGESIEIQHFESNSHIEVHIAEPRKHVQIRRAATVTVGQSELTSQSALEVRLPPGQPRRLQLGVADGWVIDSVHGSLAETSLEWETLNTGEQSTELRMTLPDDGRVIVRGHRPRPAGDELEASKLRMLDGAPRAGVIALLNVRVTDGLELEWPASESTDRKDASQLPSDLLGLFPTFPDGLVLDDDELLSQITLRTSRRKINYTADVHIDVAAQEDSLTETFTILCTPESSRIERLLVHFSQSREEPLEWRLAGGNNSGQFSARRLSAGEQASAGLRPGGDVWELLLQLARPGVFELRGQRKLPFRQQTPLALVSVDEASSQRGTLAIRALGETGLSIQNQGLTSVPSELLEIDRPQTARATFHYQPSSEELDAQPTVSIAPAPRNQAETGAWAWDLRLESRYAAEGVALHQATVRVETSGRRRINLTLPDGATLQQAWLDAERLNLSPGNRWDIELPAGRARAQVTLRYTTTDPLPKFAAKFTPPLPQLDLPVVERQWLIWLPPSFEMDRAVALGGFAEPSSMTWSQRLFGPLGRGVQQHVFNPLVRADWREFGVSGRTERAAAALRETVNNVGDVAAEYADDEELTCAQLLAATSEVEAQAGRALLIDTQALLESNIAPQTRFLLPAGGTSNERAQALLRQLRLVLIGSGSSTLLTTSERAAELAFGLDDSAPLSEARIAHGEFAEVLQHAAHGEPVAGLEVFESWRAGIEQVTAWLGPELPPLRGADLHNWNRYRVYLGTGQPRSIRVAHQSRIQSLAWAALLATIGIGCWVKAVRTGTLVLMIGIAAAGALILPDPYVPIASAAVLGGLFGLAVRSSRTKSHPSTERPASGMVPESSSALKAVVPATWLLAVVHAAAAVDAAPPESAELARAKSMPYTVLVPIDQQQRPTGDKYFVPDTFYEFLLRRAAEVRGEPRGWLVHRVLYLGTLSRDPATSRLELSRFEAKFELRVFQTNSAVELPLPQLEWEPLIRAVRVDGRPLTALWSADGSRLRLGPMSVGTHRLEFDLQPAVSTLGRRQGFELTVPPVSHALLRLNCPAENVAVEIPEARGQVTMSASGELSAQLGATDRLAVRWPAGNGNEINTPNVDVEELIWVKVRPGTTVLDARFKYRLLAGQVRTLRILADSRLRLLSNPASHAQVRAIHTIPGEPQQIELELPQITTDQVTIDLSFLVTGASGVGSLRLPRLESTDARMTRRWLGMSVDPALQYRVQAGVDSRVVEVAEFVSAWGIGEAKPLQAYALPRGEPIWFLSTQPGEPQLTADQTTAISVGQSTARVRLEASLAITAGVMAQIAMHGPANFQVDSISVREADLERVTRWSISEEGRISVFLATPLEGNYRLQLAGRWIPPATTDYELPRWQIEGAQTTREVLALYRQPAVLVTAHPSVTAKPLEDRRDDRREKLGSLCGEYVLEDAEAAVRVLVAPNDRAYQTTAVTVLRRESDRWAADLHYHVEVTSGFVDSLQFELPTQWAEPFRVEPQAEWTVMAVPAQQRRHLVLHPAAPISGKQSFVISGRITPLPGDRLSVPDILPLEPDQTRRYVVLPSMIDGQQVGWDTLRLTPAQLPAEFAPLGWQPENSAVYEVTGDRFQASLKAVHRHQTAGIVRLCDVKIAWLDDGGYRAIAMLDVEPSGNTTAALQMPKGSELIHLNVEKLPSAIVPLGDDRYQIALGPQRLPQRIEILYAGHAATSAPTVSLQPPRISGFTSPQTLWTVFSPPGAGFARHELSSERLTASERELIRIETVAQLVQLPAEVVGEHLPEEIARWYDAWRKRYWTGRASLRRELIAARRDSPQSEETLASREFDRQLSNVDRRLGASRSGLPPLLSDDLSTRLGSVLGANRQAEYFLSRQPSGELHLRWMPRTAASTTPRWFIAAGIITIAAGVYVWLRNRSLPTMSPLALACVAAALWWLLLVPSVLGLLALVALSMIVAGRGWLSLNGSTAHWRSVPK